ncbi:MAG: toprim domain-containing protein [Gammaproteobacteria bacterium]|nr:toprim domain-containing protein [Gammaproteobacteria bacterium]
MPQRIPPDDIERLKQTVSIERLVEAAGIELKRHGKTLMGRCPFHDDKTPSLAITPDKNLWHCLGACHEGGDVFQWVMKRNGVSFRHAYELLREGIGALTAQPVKQTTVRALPPPVQFDADDQALLNQVIDYYHRTLTQNREGLAYLEKRGLVSSEAIEYFKLGLANRTLGLRLPNKQRKSGADIRAQLEKLGIMRASGHEHFAGCLIVPILDAGGNVVEVYGRKTSKVKEGEPKHLYLPGPHAGVFNLDAIKVSDEIILCEALIDALTFWCAGFRHVTSSYGTGGFTDDHLAAFQKYGTKRVLIAYDRDEAGDVGAAKVAELLLNAGIDCYRIEFPKGMDANEYALRMQPASKSLGLVIRSAIWLGKGKAPALTTDTMSVDIEPVLIEATTPSEIVSPTIIEPAAPASPLPEAPKVELVTEIDGEQILIGLGDRRYRIRGLAQNPSLTPIKVNVLVSRNDAFHVDTFDINIARHRAMFATLAAKELNLKDDVLIKDLGRIYLKLEALHEATLAKTNDKKPELVTLTDDEKKAALDLLRDVKLLDRILADFHACGVVGEETNKLVGYLAAVSRKLDKPLAVIVQSTSAAGKSSLMEACLAFVPEEERIQYSAITGQALFYMGNINLKHKVLALSEEEGAARASYALKLLQSEGKLTIASTAKDPETGRLETQPYSVEGPVMIFMTTTAIDIDDELMNRCLVLAVDENREQTRAIHQLQREAETLEGFIAKEERSHLLKLHQNAQRLLKSLHVVNPFARALTFPDTATRMRRDHTKYLALIRAIALVHQHQRIIKTMTHRGQPKEYIEASLDDIEIANKLAHDVLGRTLDELPPQTRRLLLLLDHMVSASCVRLKMDRCDFRFSRREVREFTSLSDTQLRLHIDRLVELEYLIVHRGGRGQSFVYELIYDGKGKDGKPFVPGLIDVEKLRSTSTTKSSRGSDGGFAGSTRPQRGVNTGGSRPTKNNETLGNQSVESASRDDLLENALPEPETETES